MVYIIERVGISIMHTIHRGVNDIISEFKLYIQTDTRVNLDAEVVEALIGPKQTLDTGVPQGAFFES